VIKKDSILVRVTLGPPDVAPVWKVVGDVPDTAETERGVTGGQCYDRYFGRFFIQISAKMAIFFKNINVIINILHKLAVF
jgi:hypothetical protein